MTRYRLRTEYDLDYDLSWVQMQRDDGIEPPEPDDMVHLQTIVQEQCPHCHEWREIDYCGDSIYLLSGDDEIPWPDIYSPQDIITRFPHLQWLHSGYFPETEGSEDDNN